MKTRFFGYRSFLLFFAAILFFTRDASAVVGFSLNPTTVSNTFTGTVSLQVTGLTNGEKVIVQKFLDANTNGVVDAGDLLWQQFSLTDGSSSVFFDGVTAVTNFNVPGDTDGSANGTINALLHPSFDFAQLVVAKYLIVVSSPTGHFTPITNSFAVTNFPFLQSFTGNVVSNATPVPNAAVILFQLSSSGDLNPIAGTVANNSGAYSIKAPVGGYIVAGFKSNYVANLYASPSNFLNAGVTNTTNVPLTNGTRTISGTMSDANNPSNKLTGFLMPVETDNGLFAVTFPATNGNFSISVPAAQWKIGGNENALAQKGYLSQQNKLHVDTTSNNVFGADFSLPKGNAGFYGSVKDGLGNPIPGVFLFSYDDFGTYETEAVSDSNGNYFALALANPTNGWSVQIDYGGPSNYLYTGQSGSFNLTNNQAYRYDFTGIPASNTITGHVQFNGNPVTNVGVYAYANISNSTFNTYADTDSSGNYSLLVASGPWNVGVNCGGGDDSLDNRLGNGNYLCPNEQPVSINNNNGTANFTIANCNSLQVATPLLPDGTVGTSYDFSLQASGCYPSFNWSLFATTLPPGLQLDPSGEIHGTPATNGAFGFLIVLTDAQNNTVTQAFFINIAAAAPPVIAQAGSGGGGFHFTFNGNNGNYFTIQYSSNLSTWLPVLITNPPNSSGTLLNYLSTNRGGYYRGYPSGLALSNYDITFGSNIVGVPFFFVNLTNPSAVIPVYRSNSVGSLCVNYSVTDLSGSAGCAYTPVSGSLCFGPGVTSNSFSIPLNANCNSTAQSMAVQLNLSNPNGTNVLHSILVIQRPKPILAVFPSAITLAEPDNCPQSITISNAGPHGSVLNYLIADDGALGGFLDLNDSGSSVSGSLFSGQTNIISFTVLQQFATNWTGSLITTPGIYTPDAANFTKSYVSVTIKSQTSLSQQLLGNWHGTWSGISMPQAVDNFTVWTNAVSGTWTLNLTQYDPVAQTASGSLNWVGNDSYWTYTVNQNGGGGQFLTGVAVHTYPVNITVNFNNGVTTDGSLAGGWPTGCGVFRFSLENNAGGTVPPYGLYFAANLSIAGVVVGDTGGWDTSWSGDIFYPNWLNATGFGLSSGSNLTGTKP